MKRLGVIVALGAAVGGLPPREVQGRLSAGAARRAKVVMGRRIGLLVSLVAVLALGGGLLGAAPAWATPPKHFHLPINVSFRDDDLSAACGFDVFDAFAGTADATLFSDQAGTVIREIDTFPTFTSSITAPSTGKSIVSRAPAVLTTDYTGGAAVGTPAIATVTGLQFMLQPGVMFAGRQVFDAVVVGHGPGVIPNINFTSLISQSGNFFSGDTTPLICAALSGP